MKYLFVGIISGMITGMGMGGGSLLIIILVACMGVKQPIAQQFNLLYYIPTVIVAILIHGKNKTIEKNIAKKMLLPSMIGSGVGAYISTLIQASQLKKYFGIFLFSIRNI